MSDEVDLVVVSDRKLAEQIAKGLKRAGIACAVSWPEDLIADGTGLLKPAPFVPPTTVVGGASRAGEQRAGAGRRAVRN